MPKIKLTGYVIVPPARRAAAVEQGLKAHIDLTRAETGCELFDVRFCEHDPRRLLVHELFTSKAAFDAHQSRAAKTVWADITAGLKRHYSLEHIE